MRRIVAIATILLALVIAHNAVAANPPPPDIVGVAPIVVTPSGPGYGLRKISCPTCSSSGSSAIIIGTTTISGGATNGLLYNLAGVVANLATANNGVLVTNGSGAPTISTTLPSGLTIPSPNITGNLVSTSTNALNSATTIVNVSAATAPSPGQVLTATSSTAATWQTPATAPTAANPTATAGPTAINGTATTYMRSDGAPAIQKASAIQFGLVETDGSTISNAAGVISCTTATTGQLGCVRPDGATITITGGVITAVGGSATSIVPGTTTIGGGTPPCAIVNSAGTTMVCDAINAGVITAMANAVNAASGLLTFSIIGTSGALVPVLNGNNTWAGTQAHNDGSLALNGSTSGQVVLHAPATGGGAITFPAGAATLLAINGNGSGLTGLTYSQLPALAANQLLGALTATTPSGLAVPSCSTAGSALNWTSGTGFSCNTSITAASMALGGLTGLGANVATALAVAVGNAGAFVTFNGAGGTPSSIVLTNATGTAASLTAGIATTANALNSATTTIVVNGATAPGAGQVLTATSGTAANWQTPAAAPAGANPSATASNTAVNGVATTFMRSDAAPAIQLGSASQFGLVKVDGTTITASAGVISASGGSATTIIPGTTTITGATAPCAIVNSATTVMACDAISASVITAMANAVNAASGLLTFSIIGTSGATVPLLNGNNTYSGTSIFSGAVSHTGALPTQAAGTLGIAGNVTSPTLAANGEGDVYLLSTTGGLALIGQGSTNDLTLLNKAGSNVCVVPTGTTTFNCTGLQVGGVAVSTATAANPTATAGSAAVNGSATTFMRSDAAPAVALGSASTFGVVKVDGTTITASAGVISAVGGSATSITPGTTTISGGLSPCLLANSTGSTSACITLGTTFSMSGGALASLVPDTTHTVSASVANAGGQDNYNGSSITATGLAAPPANSTQLIVNQNASALTIANNSVTVNGLALSTTLRTNGFYVYTSNGTSWDAYGFPGFGTITTNALMKFADGSGAATASTITDAGAGVTIGSPTGGAQGAGTLNATGLFINGATALTIAGSNHNVLFNGSGALSGSPGFNFDGTSIISIGISGTATGTITFATLGGGVTTLVPTSSASSPTITLPSTSGTVTVLGNTVTGSSGTIVEATSPSIATPTFTGTVPSFTVATITGALTGHASADCALAACTMTGELTTVASATGTAGLNLPQGAAPTAPVNGDLWTTASGLFVRIAGATVGPLAASGGAPAFSSITSGTNTAAAMVVGSGATLAITGAAPTQAAGTLGLAGGITTPTLAANGEGDVYLLSTTGGLALIGQGSTNDISVFNKSGTSVCTVATGTTNWNCTGLQVGGTAVSTAAAANPTATAGSTANNGTATTFMRSDASPAVALGSASTFGLVKVDGTTITASGGVITASGGSATTITPGTTTVSGATAPCLIANSATTVMQCVALSSAFSISGGTLASLVTDSTHTVSAAVANPGGQDNYNGTSITATGPASPVANATQLITNQNATVLTIANNSVTVNGLALSTSLHTNGFYSYTFNGTSWDAYGFPGFGTITTNAVMKFLDGSGAAAASTITDAGAGVTVGSPTGGAQGAGTVNATGLFINGVAAVTSNNWTATAVTAIGATLTNSAGTLSCTTATASVIGCSRPDGTTITISAGVLTASGGSATTITPGTTTVVGATSPCVLQNPSTTVLSCGVVASTLLTSAATTHTTSATTANLGGEDDYNGSSITATLATLASGQTAFITDQNATTLTIANNSQTVNGLPLSTSLHTGGFYGYNFNTTTSQISAWGFPGFGTITSGALMKFLDGTGAATAGDLSGDITTAGALVTTLATVNANVGSFGDATHVGQFTVNAKGLITAAASVAITASASTITPGTTTISGATAPCAIVNSATTVMACDALGTGVVTALAVNVGSAGAFVTFNGAGGTPSALTLTNATGLPAGGLVAIAANTVLANATSGSASPTAFAMPSCSTASSALIYTSGTGIGCTANMATLNTADQTLSGGFNLTAFSIGTVTTGTTTIDCGKNPGQWMVDAGASTIAAPTSDGSCLVRVYLGGGFGTITFSGFNAEGTNTGDTIPSADKSTATATFTNASANIGWTNTLSVGQPVYFTNAGGGLPTNFTSGTVYYVIATGLSGTNIQVAATPGGTAITAGSAGTGTQTGHAAASYLLSISRVNGGAKYLASADQ
jgi:hypothetical protein